MALIAIALWAASLAFGWLHQPAWLVIPPVVFLVHTIRENMKQMHEFPFGSELRRRAEANFYGTMIGPTIAVTLWNGVLNSAIFGAGWFARNFASPI